MLHINYFLSGYFIMESKGRPGQPNLKPKTNVDLITPTMSLHIPSLKKIIGFFFQTSLLSVLFLGAYQWRTDSSQFIFSSIFFTFIKIY